VDCAIWQIVFPTFTSGLHAPAKVVEEDEQIMNLSAWRYYVKFYRQSFQALGLSVAVSIGQSLLFLPITFLVRHAFDEIVPSGDFRLLALTGVAIALLNLASSGMALWIRYVTLKTTRAATRDLRTELLHRCCAFPRSYYSEVDHSRLHASIVQDTGYLDAMSNALVAQLLPSIVICVTLSAVLIYLNRFLFLVLVSSVPLLLFTTRLMKKRIAKHYNEHRQSCKTYSKGVLFVLQMMDLTRVQTAEQLEIERHGKQIEELRQAGTSFYWLQAAYRELQNTVVAISIVLILIVGGKAVAVGSMTLGELLSFYVAVGMMGSHLRAIWSSVPQLFTGNESLITLHNILQTGDSPPYSGRKQLAFSGKITLDSVYFQYKDQQVLQDVNLTINPNTMVTIIGPNGAGKTTIAYLILGLYRPQAGQLYADDYPFDELDTVQLRQHIGMVMQDPIIFSGTIWENITYGHPNASFQKVVWASELATAHEFIQELPQGYNTFVGEGGVLLSAGQRQRIAVARALLRQPKLLILDEPTNHLDADAVRRLMNNLKRLDNIPAILMISHDMDIVREAQHVYTLQGGCIVASGHPVMLLQERVFAKAR
jgi:ATP-binding cassette subfamily B protein